MKHWAIGIVVLLGGVGLAVMTSSNMSATEQGARVSGPRAAPMKTASPQSLPEPAPLTLPTRTHAELETTLFARVSGYVLEHQGELGDHVQEGSVLAVIDAPELKHEERQRFADLAQAKADLKLRELALTRAQKLIEYQHISEAELDQLIAKRDSARARVKSLAAQHARLLEMLKYREVKAPFSGYIVERRVDRGDLVAADQTQGQDYLYRLAQLNPLRLVVDVPQTDIDRVKKGGVVTARFSALSGAQVEGRVERIGRMIDPDSGTLSVEVVIDNEDARIPAGLVGQITFNEESSAKPGWRLPQAAVIYREGEAQIAVVEQDKVAYRKVSPGRNLGEYIEVFGRLDGKTRVIMNPNRLLREGDAFIGQKPKGELEQTTTPG